MPRHIYNENRLFYAQIGTVWPASAVWLGAAKRASEQPKRPRSRLQLVDCSRWLELSSSRESDIGGRGVKVKSRGPPMAKPRLCGRCLRS